MCKDIGEIQENPPWRLLTGTIQSTKRRFFFKSIEIGRLGYEKTGNKYWIHLKTDQSLKNGGNYNKKGNENVVGKTETLKVAHALGVGDKPAPDHDGEEV